MLFIGKLVLFYIKVSKNILIVIIFSILIFFYFEVCILKMKLSDVFIDFQDFESA